MSKEYEELVEEIMQHLVAIYDLGQSHGPSTFSTYWFKERAKGIITRILQAIREGRVKLPGEVGRSRVINVYDDEFEVALDFICSLAPDDILIALSPEGQEEEG